MMTSYFSNPKARAASNALSIARMTPNWWGAGRRDISLAPSGGLLRGYKSGKINWIEYVDRYEAEVLDRLEPESFFEKYQDSILVCWCGPENVNRCHRRLIADWIERCMGIEVPEL